jgi:hypothetical protein
MTGGTMTVWYHLSWYHEEFTKTVAGTRYHPSWHVEIFRGGTRYHPLSPYPREATSDSGTENCRLAFESSIFLHHNLHQYPYAPIGSYNEDHHSDSQF